MSRQPSHSLCLNYSRHPLYSIYWNMKTRCYNASEHNFPYYQGKGIKLCDEWLASVRSFYDWAISNGWKKGLSIDRIDSNKNYCPENCCFITTSENSRKRILERGFPPGPGRNRKFNDDIICGIRKLLLDGIEGATIARKFNVSNKTVYKIRDKKIYIDVLG
jgi:hypothetical protein